MHIERVQVDEGFLDGLDLRFDPGLNVIIGARGSGKTSLIELIRFCLAAPAFTDEARERGHQQALSVLRGGQVTVTLSDGEQTVVVVRSASDEDPRSTAEVPRVTILGQGEIEAVGAQPSGRLHLVDRLTPTLTRERAESERVARQIRSMTSEIRDLLKDLDQMESQIAESQGVSEELVAAREEEEAALASVEASSEDRSQLDQLQRESAQLKVRRSVLERSIAELEGLDTELVSIANRSVLADSWPEAAGDVDTLQSIRAAVQESIDSIARIRNVVQGAVGEINVLLENDVSRSVEVDEIWRQLRQRLDQVERGVGEVTRRVEALTERAGQVEALRQRLQEVEERADSRIEQRDALYRELDSFRQLRFESRNQVADALTQELSPNIVVEASRSMETRSYAETIISGLRGSGLHYSRHAPTLAMNMSPLELVKAVESRDAQALVDACNLSDRVAESIIQALADSDLSSIIASPIEDGITLKLLDGAEYKESQEASIGQRCTIVLPLLLARHGDILLVDQPEDQIDNSFIAGTLVRALTQREEGDQLILASHNANIPVLGEADAVVALASNGKRGWVDHRGGLDDPEVVTAITTVMEGGKEAFERRAEFYRSRESG